MSSKSSTVTKPPVTGKPVKIASLGSGDVFYFTSTKNKNNTGFYLKMNSAKNRAVSLQNYKVIRFDGEDRAIPTHSEFVVKSKAPAKKK